MERDTQLLDVVESDTRTSGALAIMPALIEAGGKKCDQLTPGLKDIPEITISTPECLDEGFQNKQIPIKTPEYFSPHNRQHRRTRSRQKQLDLQIEGLRNARNTVTIFAVLVATVTFTAGINPPGGFSQDTGKALRGDYVAFKVFLSCNIVALFLSIGVVNVLVSIVPFTRKTMLNLLSVTHKVMWVSTLFMTITYIAAVWTIMPNDKGTRSVLVELIVLGGGCTILVFFGLCFMLTRHWHNKYTWRKIKKKKMKDASPQSSISRVEELKIMKNEQDTSSNSDMDSSDHGYYLY